uniref:HtrA protease/chaperone protein n=1 Tax=uncultured Armatimonadetes bacterium TaxID=157466 RepID=A0A6J4JW31_9BACT|nr:HtrA protease/chaperone protein [uncultured Armatimonadetes bacterium]
MGYDRRVIGAVPVAALAGALGATLLLGGRQPSVTAQDTPRLTQEQRATATSLEGAFMRIADSVRPASVYITSRTAEPVRPGGNFDGGEEDSPFGDLFPFRGLPRGPRQGRASGSGIIVRPDGYILTNDHVVASAPNSTVTVTLDDGREFKGKVFRDQRSDLAVVKIDAGKPLPFVRMTDSNSVRVGQWAVAIGSPFGQQNTMTAGIVSALHRKSNIGSGSEGRYYPNLIQTDASINPGNSGGPLLNINGELIGINVAIYSPTGASAGIGYAIPANTAKTVMEQLITRGRVVRGYLGLAPEDIPAGLRARLGTDKGAYVRQVSADTPAQKAGIRAGDVITRFGNKVVTNEVDLRDAISATAPGTRVTATLLRGGQSRSVDVTVGSLPDERVAAATPVEPRPAGKLGMDVQPLTADAAEEMKLGAGVKGVVVGRVNPGSPASEGGLQPRDVITAVNGQPVTSVEALNRAVAAAKADELVTLTILRSSGDASGPSETVVNITVP